MGHNYVDHNYIGHDYTRHNYMGHNYIGAARGGAAARVREVDAARERAVEPGARMCAIISAHCIQRTLYLEHGVFSARR